MYRPIFGVNFLPYPKSLTRDLGNIGEHTIVIGWNLLDGFSYHAVFMCLLFCALSLTIFLFKAEYLYSKQYCMHRSKNLLNNTAFSIASTSKFFYCNCQLKRRIHLNVLGLSHLKNHVSSKLIIILSRNANLSYLHTKYLS